MAYQSVSPLEFTQPLVEAPIASVAPQAVIIVTSPDLPVSSLRDLIALAKQRSLNYGTPGAGSVSQLVVEYIFTTQSGARMTHIPYSGAAPTLTAAMAGQVEVASTTMPPAVTLVKADKLKGIAITTPVRSVVLPQVMETFGTWAATKGGLKQSYTMVTDYGPGHDAEAAFQTGFKGAGGTIVGSVRFPVANPDFSAFVQRAKDLAPQSIYIFIPGGAQPAALGKAFAERGIDLDKTKVLGSGETTAEAALKSMGDTALGIITAWHYDYMSKNPLNVKFVKEYQSVAGGRNPDFFSIGGYDGMHAIYEALKKTKGKTDAEALVAAAKGMKWESPRGPMMIDPETRDVVQNVYIRRVQKVGGELVNVPFATIPMVKDPAGERRKTGQK